MGEINYRRFLDGDNDGLAEIIRQYRDGLVLYLNTFVSNITVAEDLCEDTFVKLGVKRPRYSGKASFKTWLYTIARNTAIDHLRRSSRTASVSIDECREISSDEASLEQSYIAEEERILLHRAMMRLRSEHRQILWLVYFEDMAVRDCAAIMKKKPHAAEMLLHRAKTALKRELEKEDFTYEKL